MGDQEAPAPGYRDLLRVAEARWAFAGSCAARLSFAVLPLALVLLVREATGSFAVAGLAAGGFTATATVLAPARARLLDRYGPRRALTWLTAGYAVALVSLVAAADRGGIWCVSTAAVTGALAPPLGPAMRVLWARLLRERQRLLQTAYAFDSVAEESVFVAGPLIAGGLIALVSARAATLAVVVLICAGSVSFVLSTAVGNASAGRAGDAPEGGARSPLSVAGLRTIVISLAGVGLAVGVIEVAVPAFAVRSGSPAAGGVMLALLSVGSVVGGLYYGRRSWRRELSSRFLILYGMFSCALMPLTLAHTLPQVGALMVLSGLAVAPLFTSAYLLVDRLVTGTRTAPTEANTWVSTANNGGAAIGSAAAGALLESAGLAAAFAATFLAVACIAIVTAVRRSTLAPARA
jgi:MFS family permease